MEIVSCNTWVEVQARKQDWLLIQERSDVPIFSTYDFLECYWRHFSHFQHPKFGKSQKLNVLFIYDHGVPIGVLPLIVATRVRKRFVDVKYLELLGQSFFTSQLDLICSNMDAEYWSCILNWIKENIDFHVFNFQLVNEGSHLFSLIGVENLQQYSISPKIETSLFNDFECYRRSAMTKNFQKIFSNSLNRIKKSGEEYKFDWSKYNSKEHFDVVNLISESKKVDGKYNVFNFPEMHRFIEEIYSLFQAKICFLYLGDVPIAYQVYLYYKKQCMWFDLSFLRDYRELRPGILIYAEGLRYNFDFLNILGYGEDQNKLGIANVHSKVYFYRRSGSAWGSKFIFNTMIK